MAKLTAASVEKLKASRRRREIPDSGCPGLYLIVQPSGAKSWALRFRRPGGRTAKLTLGPVLSGREEGEAVLGGPLTLAGAHLVATSLKRQRAMGHDIVATRHREKLERKAGVAKTFALAATDFVERYAMREIRRWQEQARLLGLRPAAEGRGLEIIPRGIADRWRDRPVAEIDGDDIHNIIDEVREKGVPGTERRAEGQTESLARLMFAVLSKLFAWLVERRRIKQNPCKGVHRPRPARARDRVLTDQEIRWFWAAAGTIGQLYGPLVRLLLLTGARLNEVAGMRRAELSADGTAWDLPGERTKNRRPHTVPLPPMARDILATVGAGSNFVFSTTGRSPVSVGSKVKRRLDAAMLAEALKQVTVAGRGRSNAKIKPWRLHDLRRTAATGMAEIGVPPHVVEACLNHISGAKVGVAGVYNRAAYATEKRAALGRWADHIEGLIKGRPAKIVAFKKKASKRGA